MKIGERKCYCQYDRGVSFEDAVGGLRIYIPTAVGYVNYNLVHTVSAGRNADIWRLGKAYWVDDSFDKKKELTPDGAEWDMALRLEGRCDFVGGFAHGDEHFSAIKAKKDGVDADIESLVDRVAFDEMQICVESVGYDPNEPSVAVLKHSKEYIINAEGVALLQKVEWLGDYRLCSSYMAMMPPLKTLTDRVYTDVDSEPRVAIESYGLVAGARSACVYGEESGVRFSMSVPTYPSLVGGDAFLLTDNRGGRYNKMYFVICNGADVKAGNVWQTETRYSIDVN